MDFIHRLVSQEQKLKIKKIKNYRQKMKPEQIKTHASTNKSHRDHRATYLGTYTHTQTLEARKTQVAMSDSATHNSQHAKGPKYQYRTDKQTNLGNKVLTVLYWLAQAVTLPRATWLRS
jgi:hypothetical protein